MRHLLFLFIVFFFSAATGRAQDRWRNVDSAYGPLPEGVHVYFTDQAMDTGRFRAFCLVADLKSKALSFTTDTTDRRRLTPNQFYSRNGNPLVVVNGTFFAYESNRNINLVVRKGKLVAYNRHTINGRGKDTLTYRHAFAGALGITKNRQADVAWTYTDSARNKVYALQRPVEAQRDSSESFDYRTAYYISSVATQKDLYPTLRPWKVETAIGGGPVLVQKGEVRVTNNEELKFGGKAINDKHPRTAMGYTSDNKLVILVVEGRNPAASGATLVQEALLLKDLGCVEALNLDGGGSSCLLINGRETIRPSDKEGQRPVPAVFLIQHRR